MASLAIGCSIYDPSLLAAASGTEVGSGGSTGVGDPPAGSAGAAGEGGGVGAAGASSGGNTTGGSSGAVGGMAGSPEGGAGRGNDGAGGGAGGSAPEAGRGGSGTDAAGKVDAVTRVDAETGIGPGPSDSSVGPSPTTFQDLCGFTRAVVVQNSSSADTAISQQVLATLQAACSTSMAVRIASQNAPGLLAVDGRPLWSASELGMVTGGAAVQDALAYLDMNATPAYMQETPSSFGWVDRATGNVIVSLPVTDFTSSHDLGIIQVIYEPSGRTFSLNVYGRQINGTLAAAFYFNTAVAPTLAASRKVYYVVEWTNQDGDPMPSAGDLYQLRGSR